MSSYPRRRSALTFFVPLVLASSLMVPTTVTAQASNYPSLQLPTASNRDYTAAIASGAGTSVIFQWREGVASGMHLGLDVGLTDRRGSENLLGFFGGSIGSELLRAGGDQPLDMLLSGGLGVAFGGGSTILRIPVGISLGHTFELEEGMALTPYVHPRVSLDLCSDCGRRNDRRTELSLNFDLGVDFRVNQTFSIRVAGAFSGSDFFGNNDSFAIGLNWRPGLVR